MAQKNSQSETSNQASNEQARRVSQLQSEVLEQIQEVNRHWLERAQSEATLAAEFASKLTTVRSLPDAMAVVQDWANRRMQLVTEDTNYAVSAGRTLMEAGTRLLPGNGKGPLGST